MMGISFSDVTTGRVQRGAAFVVLAQLVPGLFRRNEATHRCQGYGVVVANGTILEQEKQRCFRSAGRRAMDPNWVPASIDHNSRC